MLDLGNLSGLTLEEVLNLLYYYRRQGVHAICTYGQVSFDSVTVTRDDAYASVYGKTSREYEIAKRRKLLEEEEQRKKKSKPRNEREERYAQLVAATKKEGEEVEITEEAVVAGLKFLMESEGLPHEKVVLGLLMLDCNFTFEDLHKQFSNEELASDLHDSLASGKLVAGAGVIINVRDSEYCRAKFEESIKYSAQRYLYVVTGDESYGNGDGSYTGGAAKK